MKIEWIRKEGNRWVVECRTASGSLVEYCAKTLPAALALAQRYGMKTRKRQDQSGADRYMSPVSNANDFE